MHLDRVRTRQPDHLVIARPARRRDEHLITGAEADDAGVVQRLLGARRDDDIGGGDAIGAVVGAIRIGGDRLTEREDPFRGGVAGGAGLDGRLRRPTDRLRGVEVRLPRTEIDHLAPLRLQRLRPLRDRDRRRLTEGRDVRRGVKDERAGHERPPKTRTVEGDTNGERTKSLYFTLA